MARRELLFTWPDGDQEWVEWNPSGRSTERTRNGPFDFDPWAEKPPAGTWFPYGDPVRRMEREAKEGIIGRCRCGGTESIESPARGGEWIREHCGRCGRTIALLDSA